ncbi:hypothetical protein HPB48_025337 [Haemaphysalis longicornis]|uniref:protein-tyrosine-phosphatase n=1 Tax=Haemaphysalis longicornis TaxID=44386 RepID=A0A9J6H8R4_HAELO|nr:hypothetical protein HPB48_025337 [Haemaphysalis longicornis]
MLQHPANFESIGVRRTLLCSALEKGSSHVALLETCRKFRGKLVGRLPRRFRQRSKPPASDAGSLSIVDENDGLDFEIEEISGSRNGASSKPLPVSELQDYVQRMLACDGLKSEFISQPKGRQYPAVEAQRVENKIKNRYGNLVAYDHSRVKLKPITGVPYSDYINANYIDGYCRPKRYIATQGPNSRTVDDFWRMVWQENVCKIVMLTGLVENGKTKCEQYWPKKSANYGEVQVHFIAEETFPDYTVHQLHITLADTTREVKHFHMQSWPDHGVPLYPNVLLSFRKKVNQYRTFNEAPVVVHCSVPCSKVVQRYRELLLVDDVSGKTHLDKEFEGFHKKDKFLVTQTPSSRDVDDLWKMVIESGTRTIVTLDVFGEDSEVVPFWPKEGSLCYGDHRVECLESQNVNDMSVQVFKITSKHKDQYKFCYDAAIAYLDNFEMYANFRQ